jgi:hypothetical protein
MNRSDYTPFDEQRTFHDSTATYRALIGGAGAGKTTSGVMELISAALQYPGSTCLIYRYDKWSLSHTDWQTLVRYLPTDLIEECITSDETLRIKLVNGSVFHGLATCEAVDCDFVFIDCADEVPFEQFLAICAKEPQRLWISARDSFVIVKH